MDLKQINYFMWVYEEGSFSKAAKKAKVVQPALSMQIRRMEEEFGVQLFDRRSRGVAPTPAARKFYERCVTITQGISRARDELLQSGNATRLTGQIRIGLPGTLNRGILTNALIPFMEQNPDVDLSIYEAYTGTLVEWVRDGQVDFALGVRPSEEGGLIQKLIHRDAVVLMSGRPLNGSNFTPCDLSRMSGLKLIVPSRHQSFGSLVGTYIGQGQIKVAKSIEVNGTVASIELARGSDWGLLTPFMPLCRDVHRKDMFIYPIARPSLSFDLYLVYDRRRPLTPASRILLGAIEREIAVVDGIWVDLVGKDNAVSI